MAARFPTPWQKQFPNWLYHYPEAIAAITCGLLTLLGWLALGTIGLVRVAGCCWRPTLSGGGAREGLTTLQQERELDVIC
jgi:hypothetical protein